VRFQHLLLATDLSERSRAVCVYGAALAHRLGARLTVVHADELGALGPRGSEEIEDYLAWARRVRDGGLGTLADELGAAGYPVTLAAAGEVGAGGEADDDAEERRLLVAPGRARDVVLAQAEALGADLIVMARRSRDTLETHLLGSTTKRVLRDSSRPVLVVPAKAAPPTRTAPFGPILAPSDLGDASRDSVALALALGAELAVDVHAVFVMDWPTAADLAPEAPNDLLGRAVRRIREQAVRDLGKQVGPLGVPTERQRVLTGASAAEAIEGLAEELGAALLVLPVSDKGTLQRVFVGSTASRLVKIARRPVLFLPRA